MLRRLKYLVLLFALPLTGCAWFSSGKPIAPTNTLNINIQMEKTSNLGHAITVLIQQPTNMDAFVGQSYASLSQEALDKNMTRYVYLAKSEDHHLVLPVSDTPLAIYFILDHQPVSGWNYLINSPQGAVQSFTVNTSNVTRTQNIELKAKSDDSSKKKS
ncbi:type VI secretion system lipoprotein IglE [Vibrio marisflavi]|uniref:Type VI lipoprotein IgE-like C-terminal domain-containing protein n=1 Tax=Vibrio marisflavi CECT 7928 TaxID=634439 RepID=A0ABM9A2P5_9VIBR|nr:type VI secretion system lipoprotein IglE [Vibrio marisflavi]CAH0538622.1 hypothetical protein VMF7928_01552 [Vibrio marisflavi CECT 7928]